MPDLLNSQKLQGAPPRPLDHGLYPRPCYRPRLSVRCSSSATDPLATASQLKISGTAIA